MKKIIIAGIIIIMCLFIAGCTSKSSVEPINIKYYYSPTCGACAKMDVVMNNLTTYHSGEFTLTKYDINVEKVKFYDDQIKYNGNGVVPFVIIGNASFNGYDPNDADYSRFEYIVMHRESFKSVIGNKTG